MTLSSQKSAPGNPESIHLPHVQFKTSAVRKGEEDLCFPHVYSGNDQESHAYKSDPRHKFPTKPRGRPRTSPAISSTQVFGDPFPAPPTKPLLSASARKLDSPRKKLGMRKNPPRELPELDTEGCNNNKRPQSAPGAGSLGEIDAILQMASSSNKSKDVDDHFEYNVWKVLTVVDFRRTVPPRPLFEVKESAKEREKFRLEREEVVIYCQKFGTALADCLECFSRMCKDRLAKPDPNLPVDTQIKFEQDAKQKATVAKIKVMQVKAWQSRLKGDKYINQAQARLTNKDVKGAWTATERAAKGYNGYARSKYFQSLQNSAGYTLDEKSDDSYRFRCIVALLRHLYPQFVKLSSACADTAKAEKKYATGKANATGVLKAFSFMNRFHLDYPDLSAITKSRLESHTEPLMEHYPRAEEMQDWCAAALAAAGRAAKIGIHATCVALDVAEQARVAAAKLSAKDAARIAANAFCYAELAVAQAIAMSSALVVYRDASGFAFAADATVSKLQCFDKAVIATSVAKVNVIMQALYCVARADTAAAEARVSMIRTFWIANQMVAAAEAKKAFMTCVTVANAFAKAANLRLAVVVCNQVADARVAREEENYKHGLDQLSILDSKDTMGRFREMQEIHNTMLPKDGHKKIVSYFSECQEEQPKSQLMHQIPQRMVVNLCLANVRFIASATKLRKWLRHALLADLLASRVCYWSVKETELRLVALDSQMSVMYCIREARMRVFAATARVDAITTANFATQEVAKANANCAKNFVAAVVRAREHRKNQEYKMALDEIYSLDPPGIRTTFEILQATLDDFPIPLAIQNCDEDLQLQLGDTTYLDEMQKLRVWLETAQKAEADACVVAFNAYAGAWNVTATSVAAIAVIQAREAAAACLVAAGVAKVAYDKALREFKAAAEFQKIVRAMEGRKAFKRRRAAVAAQKAAAIAKFAAEMGSYYDHVTDARMGAIFCRKFARSMIAAACIKRCVLTCYGALISAQRSQRFALRMQAKAEKEFSACQQIQRKWRGVADRVFVRNGVKAKARAVAAAQQAAAFAMVHRMQAAQRGARTAASVRLPYAALNARKHARRAAAASTIASNFSMHNVIAVKARMRSQLGTKENWKATNAAVRAALETAMLAELAEIACKNAEFRLNEENEERDTLIKAGERAKEEEENLQIEEEAEEEATVDKQKKDRQPAEEEVAELQAQYDEIKEEQDQLFAAKKKSKAKKLDKKLKPALEVLDESKGRLAGLEAKHEEEKQVRVEEMLEERAERATELKKEQEDRDRQLKELSQAQQSRLANEFPQQHREEVLPAMEEVRCNKELQDKLIAEIERLSTIRTDLDKVRVAFVIKTMKAEAEEKLAKIWSGDVSRRGYASIKLGAAAMLMQKIIRAHRSRKLVAAEIARRKTEEELEGWDGI